MQYELFVQPDPTVGLLQVQHQCLLTHGIGHPYLPIPGGTGHWPPMIGGAFASHYPDCESGVNDHAERWIFGL